MSDVAFRMQKVWHVERECGKVKRVNTGEATHEEPSLVNRLARIEVHDRQDKAGKHKEKADACVPECKDPTEEVMLPA